MMMGDHADLSADVVVVGAGASGLPAAIGAARAGAKVVLLEEDPVIGGAPSDYYVCLFYGRPMTGVNAELEHLLKSKYAPTPRANFLGPLPRLCLQNFQQRCKVALEPASPAM